MIIKNKDIVERKVHDTFFLIDITENYMDDKCNLYEINEIGYFIWKQIDILENITDIVDALFQNISEVIDYSIVYNDVVEFINVLRSENFLEVKDGRK